MSNHVGNRVLGRLGARELSERESERVYGGISTQTFCTVLGRAAGLDGDPGECGGA